MLIGANRSWRYVAGCVECCVVDTIPLRSFVALGSPSCIVWVSLWMAPWAGLSSLHIPRRNDRWPLIPMRFVESAAPPHVGFPSSYFPVTYEKHDARREGFFLRPGLPWEILCQQRGLSWSMWSGAFLLVFLGYCTSLEVFWLPPLVPILVHTFIPPKSPALYAWWDVHVFIVRIEPCLFLRLYGLRLCALFSRIFVGHS